MTATATRKGRPKPERSIEAPAPQPAPEQAGPAPMVQALTVAIDDVAPSPLNPRKSFDAEGLEDLAQSIRSVGVLQPIVVRDRLGPGPIERGARWEIVVGERRWRAAKLAGLERIPANILFAEDAATALQAAIVENVQRQDLSPIELADAIASLLELGVTQAEAAKRLGLRGGQSRAAHLLKIRELPAEVKALVESADRLTAAHAEALTRWNDFPAFAALVARTAADQAWTAKRIAEPDFDLLDEVLDEEHPDDDPPELFKSLRYGGIFERANCVECPWGAYVERADDRVGMTPERYCLRPEHAKEIQELLAAEHVQAYQRYETATRSQPVSGAGEHATPHASEDATPEIPRLRDLGYATYERLDLGRSIPQACLRRECACIGQAIDYDEAVLDICTDPAKFRARQTQLTKARDAENKRRHVEAVSHVEEHVRSHSAVVGSRDLLLMLQACVTAAGTYGDVARRFTDAWNEASRTWLHGKAPSIERFRGVDAASLNKLAAELPAPELLKAIAETLCRSDVELRFDPDGGASHGALAEWYVGELPKRAGADWQPPEKGARA